MKKINFLLFLCFMNLFVFSQSLNPSVIASGGIYGNTSNVYIQSSIGEPVIQTLATNDIILTQGFQQPHFNVTQIFNNSIDLSFSVFPNPVLGNLLNIRSNSNEKFIINITDISGKTIINETLQNRTQIDLSSIAAGTYFLNILNTSDKIISSYKIVKY